MNLPFLNLKVHLTGGAICAACLGASYLFGVRPVLQARNHLFEVASESKQLQLQQVQLEGTSNKLESEIKSRCDEFRSRFSLSMPNEQSLIQTVSVILSRNGAELVNLREQVNKAEVTLSLQIDGKYMQLLQLIDELTRLERPNHIGSLKLTPKSTDRDSFSATIDIVFSECVDEPQMNLERNHGSSEQHATPNPSTSHEVEA